MLVVSCWWFVVCCLLFVLRVCVSLFVVDCLFVLCLVLVVGYWLSVDCWFVVCFVCLLFVVCRLSYLFVVCRLLFVVSCLV